MSVLERLKEKKTLVDHPSFDLTKKQTVFDSPNSKHLHLPKIFKHKKKPGAGEVTDALSQVTSGSGDNSDSDASSVVTSSDKSSTGSSTTKRDEVLGKLLVRDIIEEMSARRGLLERRESDEDLLFGRSGEGYVSRESLNDLD